MIGFIILIYTLDLSRVSFINHVLSNENNDDFILSIGQPINQNKLLKSKYFTVWDIINREF